MSKVMCRDNAEHYLWGKGCQGWHLARSSQLSVIEEEVPAGGAEVGHYHQTARQFFYLLAGEATLVVAGEPVTLLAGQGYEVAPGVHHRFENRSCEPVRFLVISSPPAQGDRVEESHD